MALLRMTLTGYRCFESPADIELRPLTIVLGRNNSGKSALVRAPMVIEKGIRTNSPEPIDLDAIDEEILESFKDLIYGQREHGSITIGLDLNAGDESPLTLNATIQHIDESDRQVVSSLAILHDGQELHTQWTQSPADSSDLFHHAVRLGSQEHADVAMTFQGLLPTENRLIPDINPFIATAADYVYAGYPSIRYFGPFRDRPVRHFRSPSGIPQTLGSSGENVGKTLVADLVRRGGHLLDEVNEVLAGDLPGWRLALTEQAGWYAVVLQSMDDATLQVNLADAGTGVAQVLPVFVQRALDALSPPERPVLEITEQPELHLHPAAHGGLADLYLNAVRRGGTQFLIETHSETLLLRIRRRIAEGSVAPDSVALYFVEQLGGRSTARRINIGDDGGLDYWPDGVFSEDYEEARALASAQLNLEDRGAR